MRVPSGLFYEQKTAYEWRISDWSSDVCSSDLAAAGAYLQTVAAAVSSGAEVFRRDGRDGTGSLLDRAAGEIGDVAGRLAERGPEEILHDVEGFARRHPAVFFGSACLLAFGAARLLKSSRPDRIPGTAATAREAVAGSDPGPNPPGPP